MKNSKLKEILIPSISLFLICLVATALLAFTNEITKDKISEAAKDKENAAKSEVLSIADEFSDKKTLTLGEGENKTEYSYYEGLDSDKNVIGYVFNTSAKGYGGDIKIMVGVDTEGKVTGISILDISETAGLGMNADKDDFKERFVGKTYKIEVIKNADPKDNEVLALTGATITSKAVTNAVNTALELYAQTGGENNG